MTENKLTQPIRDVISRWRDKANRWSLAGPIANGQTVDALRYCADELSAILPSIDREIEAGQVEAFRNGHLVASAAFTDAIRAISPDAKNEWHQTWPPEEFVKSAFARYLEAHDTELRRRWEGEK